MVKSTSITVDVTSPVLPIASITINPNVTQNINTGAAITFSGECLDANGSPTGAGQTLYLWETGGPSQVNLTTTTVAANGTYSFSPATFNTAGSYSIDVSDTSNNT